MDLYPIDVIVKAAKENEKIEDLSTLIYLTSIKSVFNQYMSGKIDFVLKLAPLFKEADSSD